MTDINHLDHRELKLKVEQREELYGEQREEKREVVMDNRERSR